jgi:hypothetical protein
MNNKLLKNMIKDFLPFSQKKLGFNNPPKIFLKETIVFKFTRAYNNNIIKKAMIPKIIHSIKKVTNRGLKKIDVVKIIEKKNRFFIN